MVQGFYTMRKQHEGKEKKKKGGKKTLKDFAKASNNNKQLKRGIMHPFNQAYVGKLYRETKMALKPIL